MTRAESESWDWLLFTLLLLNVSDCVISHCFFSAGIMEEWNRIHVWAMHNGWFVSVKLIPVALLILWAFVRTRNGVLSGAHYLVLYSCCTVYSGLVMYLVLNGALGAYLNLTYGI